MEIKWTVSGDPHADNSNLDKIGTLFDIWEEIGNPVLILGDLLDTKEIIRGRAFNYVRRRIKESRLTFFIMVGNHDYFNLDCLEHSLESFKDLPNVVIIDKPTLMGQGKFLLMPYYDDLAKFRADLNRPEFKDVEVLFMHQGVIGFDYGNGHIADGNGHGEMDFTTTVRFRKVYSGHFHKFAEQGNLMFLGTPFTQDHGETNQIKYLGVFDCGTLEMELVETPFPRHRTEEIRVNEFAERFAELQEMSSGDIWRIRLVGTEMEISAFEKAKWPGVKFLDEPTDSDQVENSNIKDTDSNEQKFMTWAKEIKGLDDLTIALGLEILKAA